MGNSTISNADYQTVTGLFNVATADSRSVFIIGGGTINTNRANIAEFWQTGSNGGGTVILPFVSSSFIAANDTAAAGLGVPRGGIYRDTSGNLKIRIA